MCSHIRTSMDKIVHQNKIALESYENTKYNLHPVPVGFFHNSWQQVWMTTHAKHTTQNKEKKGPIMLDSACTTNALNWLIPKRRGHFHLKLKKTPFSKVNHWKKQHYMDLCLFLSSIRNLISQPNPLGWTKRRRNPSGTTRWSLLPWRPAPR